MEMEKLNGERIKKKKGGGGGAEFSNKVLKQHISYLTISPFIFCLKKYFSRLAVMDIEHRNIDEGERLH